MSSSIDDPRREAWHRAFESFYDPLVRRMRLLFQDPLVAEEAVQEAFFRALSHWREFDDRRGLSAWLFVVARNVARDWLRQSGKRAALESGGVRAEAAPGLRAPNGLPVDEIAEARIAAQEVARAILQLTPAHREVLFLFYYEGWTVEEIAARIRIRPGTVKSRLYRARQALRALLEEHTSRTGQTSSERREPREPSSRFPRLARP